MLPPRSVPRPIGTQFEATRPASPPLLPPQDLELSTGLKALPHTRFVVLYEKINYD